MKKILFYSVIALLSISLNATSAPKPEPKIEIQNQTTSLRGMVSDNLTNETLAGAVITANGQKIYSDLDGNFTISNLCSAKCQIKISLISYEDQNVEIDLQNTKTLQIKLQQR
ncbi:MAG: carboxypeptidase-like regulatory domain-containing protein [Paludibacter sp.]